MAMDWAAPFRIPSSSGEWGRFPPDLYFAVSRGETNSFARPVFLFSRAWEFRQQSDSAQEHSRCRLRAFWLVVKPVGYLIPRQRAPRPRAFLRASVLQRR